MCVVLVSKTSCKDRNHPVLRRVIAPQQEFFFEKIMFFLNFSSIFPRGTQTVNLLEDRATRTPVSTRHRLELQWYHFSEVETGDAQL